jgi:UDP-N-acetylglucosamine--N-acetylmuramyl-(pentapeptide) pyrophosphoryl-undecaprenol N-acetylglucosamine transferase
VYPALAVLETLRSEVNTDEYLSRSDGIDISQQKGALPPNRLSALWVGGRGGMEADLVRSAGIEYQEIPAAGVHGVGIRMLPRNAWQVLRGLEASRRILNNYKPDVLFFTGGYVAVPMAMAARFAGSTARRPRSLLYVPDIEPGLALKTIARFADKIATTAEVTCAYFPDASRKVATSGYPLRQELTRWAKLKERKKLGLKVFDLSADLPTLLVYGGSRGSRSINRALMGALPELLKDMQIIHICGQMDWQLVEKYRREQISVLPDEQAERYRMFAYLHGEMGAALSAADLAVSRAGASILGEFTTFNLPAILVPYPYAWRYQIVNARYLEEHGAALVVEDARLETELMGKVSAWIHDQKSLSDMRLALQNLSQPAAAEKLADMIIKLGRAQGGAK